MPASSPTEIEKERLQNFYLVCRRLLQDGTIPPICIQRAFEEVMSGFLLEENWRPTHISLAALTEAVKGSHTNIQRAHGVVGDRLDRFVRTISVLKGEEKSFEEWWKYYREHDETVLITRSEHAANKRFTFEELVEVPRHEMIFTRSGFSFRFTKKKELAWAKSTLEKLTCPGTTE